MQQMNPQVLAAIIAMMQQEQGGRQAQSPNNVPQTSFTMPPEPTQYPAPMAALAAGALGGAGFGAQLGGIPGAAVGGGLGGLLGLFTDYGMQQSARTKGTRAYNNEYSGY